MANTVSGPRVPGSEHIPFNPINAHGKIPTVRTKEGKIIEWRSPLREALYQVCVDDKDRGTIPIGPKIGQAIADQLCATTALAIKTGRITGWANPHVVAA